MRFAGGRLLGPTAACGARCCPAWLASNQRPEAQPLRFLPRQYQRTAACLWAAATGAAHPWDAPGTALPGPLGKATWLASNPSSVRQFDLSPQRKAETKSAKETEISDWPKGGSI